MANNKNFVVKNGLEVGDSANITNSVTATSFIGSLTGNADTATTLETARSISLGGVLSGSASFDGSSNITITASHTSDPTITLTGAVTGSGTMTDLGSVSIATTATADPTLTIDGDASGSATFTNLGNATLTLTVADDSHNHIISNVDGLQTALDGKVSDTGDTMTGDLNINNSSLFAGRPLSDTASIITTHTAATFSSLGVDHEAAQTNVLRLARDGTSGVVYAGVADFDLYRHTDTGGVEANVGLKIRLSTGTTSALYDALTLESDGNIKTGTNNIFHDGYHPNADTWTTGRTITLTGDVTGTSGVFDGSGDLSFATTIAANSVALGTDTTGNYVATISGTANEIEVTGSGSETAAVTIGLPNDVTIGNNLTVTGNLTVSGTTTTVNTETINLADNIITLNSNEAGIPSQNAGIEVERGTSTNVILQWNEANDYWEIASGGTIGRILTTGDEGTGNGLDADTLDGQEGTYYLDWTNVTNKPDPVVTVTLTGDVTGTANTTLTDLGNGTVSVATTIAANSVALGTDTTGNYVQQGTTSGNGISGSVNSEGGTFTVTSNATSAPTASTIVYRDAAGGTDLKNIDFVSPDGLKTISVDMLDTDTISFSGDSGQLFSITDSLTGTIFSVNDISGIPSIEVDDDGTIRLAEFAGNVLIGTATDNGTDRLQVNGGVSATSLTIGSGVTLSESTDRADLLEITSSTSTWGGLQIRNSSNEGRWSFMTDGTIGGIYDDKNSDWHIYMTENAGVGLYHNGSQKFITTSTGVTVTGTMSGTATSAQYADLAENFLADQQYPVGTVLDIGGSAEVTIATKESYRIAGTVSENPGYLMNSELEGEHVTPVAYIGRVPCRVIGNILRGDLLVVGDTPGVAESRHPKDILPGQAVGKALETYNSTIEGVIEIMVGRL